MKLNSLFTLVLALGFLFTSCSSGEDPEITITSPADGSTYSAGDVITVIGTATDDEQVTGVRFVNASDNLDVSGMVDFSTVPDTNSVSFSVDITLDTLFAEGEYEIDFIAQDNDDNEGTTTWSFNVE